MPNVAPLKMLLLIYSIDGGGAERVTVRLANQWARMGHAVSIAVMSRSAKPSYPLHETVEIIETGLASHSGNLLAGLIASIGRIAKLRRLLVERQPDVAIAMMSTAAILLSLTGPVRGCVRIGSERIFPPFDPISGVWKRLRPLGYARLDGMVVQTQSARDWMESHTRQQKIAVIANPVETPPQAVDAPAKGVPADIPPDARLVLGMGRLEDQKGFDNLVAAFAQVARYRPDWHLAIVGSGSRACDLKAQAATTGMGERIHFPGFSTEPDLWFRRAELFVLSSRFEGFPNVLIEAMAHSIACIAYDCPTGPSDIIASGTNGVLVDAGEVEMLADRMAMLMDDSKERLRLGNAAREVRTSYAVDQIAGQWLEFARGLRG